MPTITVALRRTLIAILLVQGFHVVEHGIQLFQIYALGQAAAHSHGLLGLVVHVNGGAEWMHLVTNVVFLTAILWIEPGVRAALGPSREATLFLVLAAGAQTWHVVEHLAITGSMLAGATCPCPGILGNVVPGKILHALYNAISFSGIVAIAPRLLRARVEPSVVELLPAAPVVARRLSA